MSDLLKLAEHYYVVAKDLERQVAFHTAMIAACKEIGDKLSAANMHQQPAPAPDVVVKRGRKPKANPLEVPSHVKPVKITGPQPGDLDYDDSSNSIRRWQMSDCKLPSGKTFYANLGIIGIDDELGVYGGYDQGIDFSPLYEWEEGDPESLKPWTVAEKIELANMMIERWTKFRDAQSKTGAEQ